LLTEHLVQGVDVWINTPRRPWEACGTSGMKVLVNGGINLSELDGWWAEAYAPDVGWALGDGMNHGDDPGRDDVEAAALYDLLETKVVPEFYERRETHMPTAWIKRMRESMARLTPQFSANRAVREYTEQHYLPGATAYLERTANNGLVGRNMVDWRRRLDRSWDSIRFGRVRMTSGPSGNDVEVELFLNGMDPGAVKVQLFVDAVNEGECVAEMTRLRGAPDPASPDVYGVTVSARRPIGDYTARVIPNHAHVSVPLEYARITWQR